MRGWVALLRFAGSLLPPLPPLAACLSPCFPLTCPCTSPLPSALPPVQVRVPLAELPGLVRRLTDMEATWAEVAATYPAQAPAAEE